MGTLRTVTASLAMLLVLAVGVNAGAQEDESPPSSTEPPPPESTTTTEAPPETTTTSEAPPETTTTTTEAPPETTTTTEPPPLPAANWSDDLEPSDFRIGAALVGVTLGVVAGGALTGRRY